MASIPTAGEVNRTEWRYYQFFVDSEEENVFIMQTLYTGTVQVYIRAGALPNLSDYSLLASRRSNETLTLSASDRLAINAPTGWYYIGVYGVSPSSYLLTVSINRNSFIPLYQGMSHTGAVDNGEVFYFYLEVPVMSTMNVTVSVHPTRGNPDVFMKLCSSAFDSSECQFSALEFQHPESTPSLKYSNFLHGNEQISFLHTQDLCFNSLCRYVICVLGEQDTAEFVILATYEDRAEHFLRNGVPIGLTVREGAQTFFKFQVYDPLVFRVSFQLTNIAGKSFFCFSIHTERPLTSQCTKSSFRKFLTDQRLDFVKGEDAESLDLVYFLTVHTSTQATFSILAQQQTPDVNTTVTLFPGISQRDTLYSDPPSSFRFYTFQIHYTPETAQPISLFLTPFSGRFHMYVSNSDRSYDQTTHFFPFNWSTDAVAGRKDWENSLRIDTSDPAYLLDSIYEVLIMPIDWSSDGSAKYSIMYNSGDGLITLTEGVSFLDSVESGHYRYYLFPVPNLNETVTITVTETSGDPDIYISTDQSHIKPDQNHSDYSSERYGGEAITIEWNTEDRERCKRSVHICAVYISVYGYSTAAYSIIAKAYPEERAFVEHGRTVRGEMGESQYAFYYSQIDVGKPVKIRLEPVLGVSEMYAVISSDQEALTVRAETAAYRAEAHSSASTIYIPNRSYPSICSQSPCFLDFSVQCLLSLCRFTLLVTQDEDIQLSEGLPISEHCSADDLTYFRFYNPNQVSNIVITVTHMSGGDPDLYVSRGNRPSLEEFQWMANEEMSDVLEIQGGDGVMMKGEYFIGVYCDLPGAFSIAVSSNRTQLIRIYNGRPQYGHLPLRSAAFFYFPSDLPSNLTITLTPTIGAASLYATPQPSSSSDIFDFLPTPIHHTWSSSETNSTDHIFISESDPNFCTVCNIVLGVFTDDQPCTFTLVARTDDQVTTLPNGVPVRVRLTSDTERLFAYELMAHSDLDVTMAVYSGKPRMYVGTTPGVSQRDYLWKTEDNGGVGHVKVTVGSKGYRVGWFYARVYAGQDATAIAVTAHSRDSYVTLVDGWPQIYSIFFNPIDRLLFQFNPHNESAVCRLSTWLQGFNPSVYVSFTPKDQFSENPPGPGSAIIHSQDYDVFGVLSLDLPRLGFGSFRISVYGNQHSGFIATDIGDFQLYCVSNNGTTLVALNDVEYGILDSKVSHRRYELNVISSGELEVAISPCFGSVELIVSQNSTNPFSTPIETHQKRIEDGQITSRLPAIPGTYYIIVTGLKEEELKAGVSYQLRTELLEEGGGNSSRLFPGNGGVIQWDQITEEIVKLRWAPPEYWSGERPKDLSSIRYRIYATLNSSTLMTTSCGMDYAKSINMSWLALSQDEEFGQTSMQVEIPSGRVVILNVMAITGRDDDPDLENVSYKPISVFLTPMTYERYIYKLLFAISGLILALLIGAVYIHCRSRSIEKTTMQLTEMVGFQPVQLPLASPRTGRQNTDLMSPRDSTGLMAGMPSSTEDR